MESKIPITYDSVAIHEPSETITMEDRAERNSGMISYFLSEQINFKSLSLESARVGGSTLHKSFARQPPPRKPINECAGMYRL